MPEVVLLDAGPLGIASHPRPDPDILAWMSRLFAAGVELLVPEIADYAQALMIGGKDVMVATTNAKHLGRFVAADFWQNIGP